MTLAVPFAKNLLAITDLEMTGLDFRTNEIIEIACLLVGQEDMSIIKTFESKTLPEHIETGNPVSLNYAGYNPNDWIGAPSLKEVLEQFVAFLGDSNALFAAWNNTMDWAFLEAAFKNTGTQNPFDYHRYDIWSVAAEYLKDKTDLDKISLSQTTACLGLTPEPKPHRAMNGARVAYEVLKKLRELQK